MKARIVHTKIWRDNWFLELSATSQRVFIYILTNEYINQIGIYELPDVYIKNILSITQPQLNDAKKELSPKVGFTKGWVGIVNSDTYQQYTGSINEKVQERELKCVPPEVVDTLSIPYQYPTDSLNNQKPIISNKKQAEDCKKELSQWLDSYKEKTGKVSSASNLTTNFQHWRNFYSLEEMIKSINNLSKHDWLADKHTPTLILRQRDKNRNSVDRIGELLSIKVKKYENS